MKPRHTPGRVKVIEIFWRDGRRSGMDYVIADEDAKESDVISHRTGIWCQVGNR